MGPLVGIHHSGATRSLVPGNRENVKALGRPTAATELMKHPKDIVNMFPHSCGDTIDLNTVCLGLKT